METRWIAAAVRLCGLLTAAFPSDMRLSWGQQMRLDAEAHLRSAWRRQGWRGLASATVRMVFDFAKQAVAERWRRRAWNPSPKPLASTIYERTSNMSQHNPQKGSGIEGLNNVKQDVRLGLRMFRKQPLFTLVAVLTLALGIGANTAMFSVMNAALLRYLPVPDPQQVVHLRTTSLPGYSNQTGNTSNSFSGQIFLRMRDQQPSSLDDLMAYVPMALNGEVAVRFGSEPETASGMMVSGNFFSGLGVKAARGRVLNRQDEDSRAAVAVLSHAYWTRRFARSPSVINETIRIKGIPFTIVGVAAPRFNGLTPRAPTDVWIPLQSRPDLGPWGMPVQGASFNYDSPTWWFIMMVGRLSPGTTREAALAQLNPIFHNLVYAENLPQPLENPPKLYFDSSRGVENLAEAAAHPLGLLMAMVFLVLVIACGNIAMLLMARNATRRREFGLRLALGAGRLQIFRQLLTESLLLVLAGGALGWVFANWATGLLSAWSQLPADTAPDRTVLLFTFGVCILAAIIFGLIPLRGAARIPAVQALRASSATSNQESGRFWSGRAIIAAQMALCLAVLVGTGLLVRTLVNLRSVDLGLQTENLFVFGVNPKGTTDPENRLFYRRLIDDLRVLPGVEAVTLMQNRIGSGWSNNSSFQLDGARAVNSEGRSVLRWNVVGPDYFFTLGTPILQGRDLKDSDTFESPRVVVVNRTFVETYCPDGNALGRNVALFGPDRPYSIVGVAEDSKYSGVRESPRPMAYLPHAQTPRLKMMHVELRARRDPAQMVGEIRGVLGRIDPELPMIDPTTQQAQFEQTFSQASQFAQLSIFFGLLATFLVGVGLYGTLAYRVARRTIEIGVRMALGARRGQVLWMMFRESLLVCLAGAVLGIPLAIGGAYLLRSSLFGLQPDDPITFIAAAAAVVAVTLAASCIPARRASSIDPISAIRFE